MIKPVFIALRSTVLPAKTSSWRNTHTCYNIPGVRSTGFRGLCTYTQRNHQHRIKGCRLGATLDKALDSGP